MGAIAEWFVKLGARDDGASAALGKLSKETRGLMAGISAVIPQVGSLNTAIGMGLAGGAIYLADKIATLTYNMAENGAQVERLTDSYNALWTAAGINATTALDKLRDASMGTISDQQLMLSANRALLFGFKATDDELANLLQVAAFRGRAMGLSTTQAFNDIVTGIGRMSPLILDNLGIMIDADARWKEFADALGKSSLALTGAEKRQALMNAVIEDGNAQMKIAGGLAEDNATKFEAYEAAVTNLKNAIGQLMAGPVGKFLDSLTITLSPSVDSSDIAKGTKSYRDYLDAQQKYMSRLEGYDVSPKLLETLDTLNRLVDIKTFFPSLAPILGYTQLTAEEWQKIYDYEKSASMEAAKYKGWIDAAKGSTVKLADGWKDIVRAMSLDAIYADLDPLADMTASVKAAGNAIWDAIAGGDITDTAGQQLLDTYRGAAAHLADELQDKKISLFDYQKDKAKLDALLNEAMKGVEKVSDTSSSLRSVIDSVLSPTFAGNPTNVLDAMGLHIDTADEDARRLAAIMAGGLQNEWVGYFKDKGLLRPEDLVSEQAVQARAATLLDEFNKGLRPELIDKETAKQRVRELLIGQQNMDTIAGEIMSDLQAEGFGGASVTTIKAALGDPMAAGQLIGAGISKGMYSVVGADLIAMAVGTINKEISQNVEMIKSSGKLFGSIFFSSAFTDQDNVLMFFDKMLDVWGIHLSGISGGGGSGAR